MSGNRFVKAGVDRRIVAALLAASAAVGVVNNLRVGEERRVPWSGAGISASAADAGAGADAEHAEAPADADDGGDEAGEDGDAGEEEP